MKKYEPTSTLERLRFLGLAILATFIFIYPIQSNAQQASALFTGKWSIDLRTPAQKKEKTECGSATFVLIQSGTKIVGNHSFAAAGCGRINEGGDCTVKGTAIGKASVLVVTSGRNGQIVIGTATIRGGALHWQVTDEVKDGEPVGDSGLILHKGVLKKVHSE
jgi:hypothetical protein